MHEPGSEMTKHHVHVAELCLFAGMIPFAAALWLEIFFPRSLRRKPASRFSELYLERARWQVIRVPRRVARGEILSGCKKALRLLEHREDLGWLEETVESIPHRDDVEVEGVLEAVRSQIDDRNLWSSMTRQELRMFPGPQKLTTRECLDETSV